MAYTANTDSIGKPLVRCSWSASTTKGNIADQKRECKKKLWKRPPDWQKTSLPPNQSTNLSSTNLTQSK